MREYSEVEGLERLRLSEQILVAVCISCGIIVIVQQSLYLFTYPTIDTGMWYGDESWTMLTLRALASSGVARVPEALGSSLAQSNGFVNGSVWISGLLYGLPAHVLHAIASPVHIGRAITLLVTIGTLAVIVQFLRLLEVSRGITMLTLFLLVSTNAFWFSSHCSRLDALTGLAVLLFLFLLVRIGGRQQEISNKAAFLIFFLAALSLAVYVHVPTLIALPALWAFGWQRGFTRASTIVAGFLGGLLGILLLAALYWSTTGSLHLLGEGYNQYYNVANSLPILHPFSWQVQKINTIDRFIQVWQIAPLFVLLLIIGAVLTVKRFDHWTDAQRLYLTLFLLVGVSWMLSEGPAIFYNIHILPVAAVALGVVLHISINPARAELQWALTALVIGWTAFSVVEQKRRGGVGELLSMQNAEAVQSLVAPLSGRPLVLTDQPAQDQLAGLASVRLMTNHLLLFGNEAKPLPEILHEQGVNYLLLYSTHRWRSPFRQIADSLYDLVGERTGALIDQAREYDQPDWEYLDTLRLYRAR